MESNRRIDAAVLQRELVSSTAEAARWRRQYALAAAMLETVVKSRSWKFLEWFRLARRLAVPRALEVGAIIPWQQLEPKRDAPEGTWLSRGRDAHFLIPCFLPAGWVRFCLKMISTVPGQLEICCDTGSGFLPEGTFERRAVNRVVNLDRIEFFSRPLNAVRFKPLQVEGEFFLEKLWIETLPRPLAFWHALVQSLRRPERCRRFGQNIRIFFGSMFRSRSVTTAGRHESPVQAESVRALDHYERWLSLRLPLDADRHEWRAEAAALDNPPLISLLFPILAWQSCNHISPSPPASGGEGWGEGGRNPAPEQVSLRGDLPPSPPSPLPRSGGEGSNSLRPAKVLEDSITAEPERTLRASVESVLRQLYPHWELCVAIDDGTSLNIRRILQEYSQSDARIRIVTCTRAGGQAAACQSALDLARGEYVARLDQGDELAEHALFRMAQTLAGARGLDMIYSDEDRLEADGRHADSFFKPAWSPEYFLSFFYTGRLGVYRTALVRALGGFRAAFEAAHDYDLVLRLASRGANIEHVPEVLYHRLVPEPAGAGEVASAAGADAARRALENYLETIGQPGRVEPGPAPGLHSVRFALAGRPKVSIIIPSACQPVVLRGERTALVEKCVASILEKSTYDHYEILVVNSHEVPAELARKFAGWKVTCRRKPGPFNFSEAVNFGASQAGGDFLLLLNDDMEVVAPGWIEALLEFAQQPQIGAVGAKLFYPDGRLQHVGVVLMDGHPEHVLRRYPANIPGYFHGNVVPRNYSAVTAACLMTRRDVFRLVDGFDPAFPVNFNDVDFCLKVLRAGRRIVYTPHAQLTHHESATISGCYFWEINNFKERWCARFPRDPYYSPHLSRRLDFRLEADAEPQHDVLLTGCTNR